METFDAVRTVLAVRQFADTPLPAESMRRILDAAHLTASSRNGQPWHFIAVDDHDLLQKLGQLAKTGPFIAYAPFAVVVAMEESVYAESDAGRAVQSMVLTAWSEGIGSNWAGYNNLEDVNPVLGIPPELRIIGIIAFGNPLARLKGYRKNRKPFGDVVSRNRFGEPYA